MMDLFVAIAGWLGEFLLNFFDFIFFLIFLLVLFACLGGGFGFSILSGKVQKSWGSVFLCVLGSITLLPAAVFYCTMVIGQGYTMSEIYSMITSADKTAKLVFFSLILSSALPALLIGYWMNPVLDLPEIQKIAEDKASGLLERWKINTLYEQEKKEAELEQKSKQLKAKENSLRELDTKLRDYSRELAKQRTELEAEKKKAQTIIVQAKNAIKESEIRVEELSKSNLQLKNQIQRLIPKSRQYPAVRKVALRYLPENLHEKFNKWDKERLCLIAKSLKNSRTKKEAWEKIKLPEWN